MKMTIKHFTNLGEKARDIGRNLLSKDAWDKLRMDTLNTPYSIPTNRNLYIETATKDKDICKRSGTIVKIAELLNINKIFSLGSGCGYLEYNIKKLKGDLTIVCTDYSPNSIDRLKSVFPECDGHLLFDMLKDDLKVDKETLVLMNRIDTELNNSQWNSFFQNCNKNDVANILIIPTEFISIKSILIQIRTRMQGFLGSTLTFAGYIRTKQTFISLWEQYYKIVQEIDFGSSTGFLLALSKSA